MANLIDVDNLYGNLNNLRGNAVISKSKRIAKLMKLADEFEKLEKQVYQTITGEENATYKDFQQTILNRFNDESNIQLYEDIQKIAVRTGRGEQAMEILRTAYSLTRTKEGSLRSIIKTDELKSIIRSVFNHDEKNIEKIKSEDIMTPEKWGEILVERISVKKRGGTVGGFLFDDKTAEAIAFAAKKPVSELTAENIKKTLFPLYRDRFIEIFSEELFLRLEGLNDIIAEEKTEKEKEKSNRNVKLPRSVLTALTEARKETASRLDTKDEIFLQIDSTKYSLKGVFNKLDTNFSNAIIEALKDKLEKILSERTQERNAAIAQEGNLAKQLVNSPSVTATWIIDAFGFTSAEAIRAINNAVNATNQEYFRSRSPAQIIGDLSELLYSVFFNKIIGAPEDAPAMETLGGRHEDDFTDEQLKGLDSATIAWKKGKQPATDLLLNGKFGFQVKNAFSRSALTDHDISFVSQKTIQTLFLTEFRNVIKENPEMERLPAYTAQAIYSLIENNETAQDDRLWPLLTEIYSFFIAEILDLGEYQEKTFGGDKNVFYIYLSQYIIPASEIIGQAIRFLRDGYTEAKAIHLTPVLDQTLRKTVDRKADKETQNSNLISNMRMGVDYTFYDDFIKGFDILLSNIQQK